MTQLGLMFSNLSAGLQLEAFSPSWCVWRGGGRGGRSGQGAILRPPTFACVHVCVIFMQLYDQFS